MARDRKRAKQRQRRAASRAGSSSSSRGDGQQQQQPEPESEPRIDPDQTIPDLEHGSANADIAKAAIAAGATAPEEVSEELDDELGSGQPRVGEIYPDEIEDDGYDSAEAENAVEGPDGAAAAAAVTARPERDRAARRRERGGGNRVGTFLRNSWEELKRVQWPDRETLIQASAVTVIFIAVMAAYLGALDALFNWLVQRLI